MHLVPGLSKTIMLYCSLKGRSNKIFDLQFFHHSNQPWLLTNGLKYFWLWLRIRRVIRILSLKIWLPGVSYPGESDSPWYHTPVCQSPWGIIPQRVNLPGVSYPCESISPGYDTPASQSPQGIIPLRVTFFDTKFLISHWSVAQAGLNYEKNWRSKISLDCSLKRQKILFKKCNF